MADQSRRNLLALAAGAGVIAAVGGVGYVLFASGSARVVCYCSIDEEFALPLMAEFLAHRGLDVAAHYDAESQKTVGLANRLKAEQSHPLCDVFWNNEILQTVRLAADGLFASYRSPATADLPATVCDPQDRWHGYAARARCLLVHNPSVPAGKEPHFLTDLTTPAWRGKIAIAAPLFGTTASHFAVLRTLWGEAAFHQFVDGLKANNVRVESGNMDSAKAAAEGRAAISLVDTDDALVLINKGADCRIVFPGQSPEFPGSLLLPTTVALVANSPNPDLGRRLIDAILDRATEQALADGPAGQMPVRSGLRPPKGLEHFDSTRVLAVDWTQVAAVYDANHNYLLNQFS